MPAEAAHFLVQERKAESSVAQGGDGVSCMGIGDHAATDKSRGGKAFYARFLAAFPEIEDLARAPEEKLLKLWEGLGYYNRVRNMQKAARQIVELYGARCLRITTRFFP